MKKIIYLKYLFIIFVLSSCKDEMQFKASEYNNGLVQILEESIANYQTMVEEYSEGGFDTEKLVDNIEKKHRNFYEVQSNKVNYLRFKDKKLQGKFKEQVNETLEKMERMNTMLSNYVGRDSPSKNERSKIIDLDIDIVNQCSELYDIQKEFAEKYELNLKVKEGRYENKKQQ